MPSMKRHYKEYNQESGKAIPEAKKELKKYS